MALQAFTLPPSNGGLDLVTPIDSMDPSFALELVNIFPGNGAPTVRRGYTQFQTTGTNSAIQFQRELPLTDGTSQLVVATSNKLYSITEGAVISANISPGHSNGFFNSGIFGNRMYLCSPDGSQKPIVYTGSGSATYTTFTATEPGTSTPVNMAKMIAVNSYRERVYFIENNSLRVWYGNTKAVGGGALSAFDFQYYLKEGGYLLHAGTYTNQTAQTAQDLFFICTSEGEIAFYQGSSPEDSNWSVVARYVIGRPLGFRAFIRVNQDIWILTQQGIVPVSALFQTDPEQAVRLVSEKVNPLISSYAAQFPSSQLWGGFIWPVGRRVYISIPSSGTGAFFLVYSFDSKAWTVFNLASDTDAAASCTFLDLPFYGTSAGVVYKGETGYSDAVNASGVGQSISFTMRTAFSFFGLRGNYKVFRDIRPILQTKRGIQLSLAIDTDFKQRTSAPSVTSLQGKYTPWGSRWGTTASRPGAPIPARYVPWSGDIEYIYDRFATSGQGHCGSVRFGGSIRSASCQILGFDIRFDLGGQV